jgi:hypothetical protein
MVTMVLLNMHSLLLNVHRYSNLNWLLDNDFLEDWNLDGNGDRLRNMDNLVYGNRDVLGYLDWYGNLLVNGNRHVLIDGNRDVLVHRNGYGDTNNVRNRVWLGNVDNLRNVHDLGDLLDDGDLHWHWVWFWYVHHMRYWHELVHWVWLRDRHRFGDWNYLVNILYNLMYVPVVPAMISGMCDGKECRKSNNKDLHSGRVDNTDNKCCRLPVSLAQIMGRG